MGWELRCFWRLEDGDNPSPPAGVEPPLQALWYAAKTQFAEDDLVHIFERIGGNDGTPEDAGPPGSPGWHWTTGHMICQTVEYGYN